MKQNKQRNITLIIISILIGLLGGFGFYETNKDKSNEEIVNNAIEEVKDYVENASTTEIPNLNETDEQSVEVQETESEGFEEQGQVSYEG